LLGYTTQPLSALTRFVLHQGSFFEPSPGIRQSKSLFLSPQFVCQWQPLCLRAKGISRSMGVRPSSAVRRFRCFFRLSR